MPRPFSDFTDQFFWSFKRMDNVNYNFETIEVLYAAKKANNNNLHFNKPIIILIISIIECTLYDFIMRIHQYRQDSFPNITQAIVSFFRNSSETDELKVLIPQIQTHNLLRVSKSDNLYTDLEHLRKIRNRVHIQNKYLMKPIDEYAVFTEMEMVRSQQCLEKVYDALCNVYPRWKKQPIPMSDFPRPWL
jgi:hypothetical protein